MLPLRRRTWPIVLGVMLLLFAVSSCLFSFAWSWDAPVPAGHDTHRLAIEHGRLIIEQDTLNTPPANKFAFLARLNPGVSIGYEQTYIAPSNQSRRVPFAMFMIGSAIALVFYSYYHKKHPPGHCTECGYDLKDSANACPECGHAARGDTVSP